MVIRHNLQMLVLAMSLVSFRDQIACNGTHNASVQQRSRFELEREPILLGTVLQP